MSHKCLKSSKKISGPATCLDFPAKNRQVYWFRGHFGPSQVCYVQHSSLLLVVGYKGGGIQVYADMIFGRRSVMTRMVIPHGHAYPLLIFKLTSIKHLSLIAKGDFNCHQNFFGFQSFQSVVLLPSLERSHVPTCSNLGFGWQLHQVTVCRTSGSLLFHCFAQPLRNSFRSTKEVWPARTPW